MAFLFDYQMDAVDKMRNGNILVGGVGSGKSRTGIYVYFKHNGGEYIDEYIPMGDPPQDLYIITTAKKRDSLEWNGELCNYLLYPGDNREGVERNPDNPNLYANKVVVESWNNIQKFKDVKDAFFIFDEDRVVGYGAWAKSFIKIAKNNNWILLTATPGDNWGDYMAVFIANGFYKNKTEFEREHVVYSRFTKFPKVDRYVGTKKLERYRDNIVVQMDYSHEINVHHEDIWIEYNRIIYKDSLKNRWNPYEGKPFKTAAELCYTLRKIVNSDETRANEVQRIAREKEKVIIFYSFDYELDILKSIDYGPGFEVAELNGHKHQPVPDNSKWVYLVNYAAGAEAWNCIRSDTIIFYSQNYSYKVMVQAAGRIDRLNTPYTDLYYYHLKSKSGIDLAISKALHEKKKFNENLFVKW